MNVLRRITMGIGGTVVVALVIGLAAPKTVRAVVSTLVTVANTPANPVPNRDVDNSANFPFSSEVCIGDANFCQGVTDGFTVPAATSSGVPVKRLIIESISGACDDTSGGSNFIAGVVLQTAAPADSSNSSVEIVVLPAIQTEPGWAVFNASVHFYASPGASVLEGTSGVHSGGFGGGCFEAVSGYLVTQ